MKSLGETKSDAELAKLIAEVDVDGKNSMILIDSHAFYVPGACFIETS